jgi:hypothetical protein
MLILKLNSTKKINEDGSKIILTDSTGVYGETIYTQDINTEGTYTTAFNNTGYGSPNTERTALAFFIAGTIDSTDGPKDVEFEVASHTANQFYAINKEDAVYSFYLIGVPITADYNTLVTGKSGFHIATNKIYTKGNSGAIEVTALSLANTEYSSAKLQFPLLVRNGTLFTDLVAKRVELILRGDCNERDIVSCSKAIDDVETGIYAATYEAEKKNWIASARIIELLNTKDYSHILNL